MQTSWFFWSVPRESRDVAGSDLENAQTTVSDCENTFFVLSAPTNCTTICPIVISATIYLSRFTWILQSGPERSRLGSSGRRNLRSAPYRAGSVQAPAVRQIKPNHETNIREHRLQQNVFNISPFSTNMSPKVTGEGSRSVQVMLILGLLRIPGRPMQLLKVPHLKSKNTFIIRVQGRGDASGRQRLAVEMCRSFVRKRQRLVYFLVLVHVAHQILRRVARRHCSDGQVVNTVRRGLVSELSVPLLVGFHRERVEFSLLGPSPLAAAMFSVDV